MGGDDSWTALDAALITVRDLPTARERLCEASRLVLQAAGVLLSLSTPDGPRVTLSSTGPRADQLNRLQLVTGEGPVSDALSSGLVVSGLFGHVPDERWPALRALVAEVGFEGLVMAVPLWTAMPLQCVLMVHRTAPLRPDDEAAAHLLADVVGTGLLHDPDLWPEGVVLARIVASLDVVHQATGILVAQAHVRPDDALALLRSMAFSRSADLRATAEAVVGRTIALPEL